MISQRTGIILIALSVFMLVLAIVNGSKLPIQLADALTISPHVTDSATATRLALINRAVSSAPAPAYFDYTANFENPFKLWNEQRIPANQSSSSVKSTRVPLSLKGILIKDRPLAILDNGMGETQIRAAGEKAFDQLIINISDTRVTLRDHLGKYEISVEER